MPLSSKPPVPFSAIIASPHCIVREGLAVLLNADPECRVVGLATTAGELTELRARHEPQVVIVEHAPELDALAVKRQWLAMEIATPMVIVAASCTQNILREARRLGVGGFLPTAIRHDVLLKALRRVVAEGTCNSFDSETRPGSQQVYTALSSRETEVLGLMRRGMSNIDIGRALHISAHTVLTHAKSLFGKLGAANRAEAVTLGFEAGLLRPGLQGRPDGTWGTAR